MPILRGRSGGLTDSRRKGRLSSALSEPGLLRLPEQYQQGQVWPHWLSSFLVPECGRRQAPFEHRFPVFAERRSTTLLRICRSRRAPEPTVKKLPGVSTRTVGRPTTSHL